MAAGIDIEPSFTLKDVGINFGEDGRYRYLGTNRSNTQIREYSIASLRKRQIGELDQASEFLREQWGAIHPEASGSELITILDVGGLVLSVRDENERLIGASQVLSGASDRENQRCLITDQTAVLEEHREFGIGRALKQIVFAKALERNITRVYVTFDPGRANLWGLNVGRLGAQIVDFVENKYGNELVGKQNSADLPSDRVIGMWDLNNPRTIQRIMGRQVITSGSDSARLDFNSTTEGVAQRAEVLRRCREGMVVVDYRDGLVVFGPRTQNFGLRDDD